METKCGQRSTNICRGVEQNNGNTRDTANVSLLMWCFQNSVSPFWDGHVKSWICRNCVPSSSRTSASLFRDVGGGICLSLLSLKLTKVVHWCSKVVNVLPEKMQMPTFSLFKPLTNSSRCVYGGMVVSSRKMLSLIENDVLIMGCIWFHNLSAHVLPCCT
jgi:hypothetical protein